MLVSCNSCQKKFIVPDKAITVSGRLVQCGSCGVKWTQYPVKNTEAKKSKLNKNENSIKKTRVKKNLYTPEYLRKKHGLIINKSPREPRKDKQNEKKSNNNFGFYGYLIIFFCFLNYRIWVDLFIKRDDCFKISICRNVYQLSIRGN